MCEENSIELQNLDFTQGNDSQNWTTDSNIPVQTENGRLVLSASSNGNTFTRFLGDIDELKNRVNLILDFTIKRPFNANSGVLNTRIQVIHNASQTILETFTAISDNVEEGIVIRHNFDRIYKYQELSGGVSLRITIIEGQKLKLHFEYLRATNYRYCPKVRTYFGIKNIIDLFEGASSINWNFTEWKIDSNETLTQEYFNENNAPSSYAQMLFALADIDGLPRIQEQQNQNSFNPFVNQSNLVFDTSRGFHYGKPLGTASGNNYGEGILELGIFKPAVLNGNLDKLKGVFSIDIDYTKSLKVVFDLIISKGVGPSLFRTYTIQWDAVNCAKSYSYIDRLRMDELVVVNENGFLSGLTREERPTQTISCQDSIQQTGNKGVFELLMDYGSSLGQAGINYNAGDKPEKFEIFYNGQVYSTGYVGSSDFDQQLINAGVDQAEINTSNPSNGQGELLFPKPTGTPELAVIRITSPLDETFWSVEGICPNPIPQNGDSIEIAEANCNTDFNDIFAFEQAFVNSGGQDPNNYILQVGDMVFSDQQLQTPFNGQNLLWRKGFTSGLQGFQAYEFRLSNLGIVTEVNQCGNSGGNQGDGSVQQVGIVNNDTCFSEVTYIVNVPLGESRVVRILPSNSFGSPNVDELITMSKTYTLRIEGSDSSGPQNINSIVTLTSTITGGAVADTAELTRTHGNQIC